MRIKMFFRLGITCIVGIFCLCVFSYLLSGCTSTVRLGSASTTAVSLDSFSTKIEYNDENTVVIFSDTKNTEKKYILSNEPSDLASAVQYEKNEWGWIAKVGGETIYIRTDDIDTDEPLYEQPRAIIASPYRVMVGGYRNESAVLGRVYNLYISESTIVGAVCEIFGFEDEKIVPVSWEYGESPNMEGPQYQKHSDDKHSDFYTGDYALKRSYDIYLGENSICGAICETLRFQDGAFVPTKWEFIYSPHSTAVPVAEWPKNYLETFLPDGASAIVCSGSVLGSGGPTFISYEVFGSDPAFFMSEGYGAVYIPVELDLPEEFGTVRVVDSISGNSTEISFIVSGEKTYRIDCLVYSYLWQSNLILLDTQEICSLS